MKKTLENLNFEDNEFCPSVYKAKYRGRTIIIGAFVDDLVIMSENLETNRIVVDRLEESFEIKVLKETDGEHTVFDVLGLQVTQSWMNKFTVSCTKYIEDVVKRWKPGEDQKPKKMKLLLPGTENYYFDANTNELEMNEKDYKKRVKELQAIVGC